MKWKLFTLAALSLAGLGLSARPASAWWLTRHCGINRYSTVIVCRPYNAFTPCCSGSLVCDGCCPYACPNTAPGACCSPILGNPLLGMCGDPIGYNAYAQGPMMMPGAGMAPGAMMMPGPGMMPGPAMQGPGMPMPVPQFQGPMPVPTQQTQAPVGYNLQPAGYQQAYYPAYYYPTTYSPYQQAPAYWYGY